MAIATDAARYGAEEPDSPDPRAEARSDLPDARLEDVLDESLTQMTRCLVETEGVNPTLADVLGRAVAAVPCRWAAAAVMNEIRDRPSRLSASTDASLAALTARFAVAAGASPGMLAFESGRVVHAPDLASEGRFGSYASKMVAQTPVRSVLSLPLCLRGRTLGVLTLYADEPAAFDEAAIERAQELADLAAVAVDASLTRDRADNLARALDNSRAIGVAVGVLVERYKVTPEQAFQQLSNASQHSNCKVADLARELADTGEFPPPGTS